MYFYDYLVYVIALPIILVISIACRNLDHPSLLCYHELLNNHPIIPLFLLSSNFQCSSFFILIMYLIVLLCFIVYMILYH